MIGFESITYLSTKIIYTSHEPSDHILMPPGFAPDQGRRFAGEEFDQLGFGDAPPALQRNCVKMHGSNPTLSAIKETSFVYHGKRRFLRPFGVFLQFFAFFRGFRAKKRASEQHRHCSGARFFCFESKNSGVLFAFLCSAKKRKKCRGKRLEPDIAYFSFFSLQEKVRDRRI